MSKKKPKVLGSNLGGMVQGATLSWATDEEKAIIYLAQRKTQREQIAKTVHQSDADTLAQFHNLWPTLKSADIVQFHKDGLSPDDPLVAKLALVSARTDAKNPVAQDQAAWLLDAQRKGEQAPDILKSPVWQHYVEQDKAVERAVATVPSGSEAAAHAYRRSDPSGATDAQDTLNHLSQKYPGLAAVSGGVPIPGVPEQARQQYMAAQKQLSTGGGFLDTLGDVVGGPVSAGKALLEGRGIEDAALSSLPGYNLNKKVVTPALGAGLEEAGLGDVAKAVSQGVSLATQVPMDLVNATVRNVASGRPVTLMDPTGGGSGLLDDRNVRQSPGLLAMQKVLNGENVDFGSGYFPDVQSPLWQQSAEAARQASPYLINGHAFTLGRAVAEAPVVSNIVGEPGSFGYNALSGVVDAAVTIGADPTNIVIGGVSKAHEASKVFSLVDDATKESAGIIGGLRQFVHAPTFNQWMERPEARHLTEVLAGNTDMGYALKVFKGDASLAAASLDATTPQEIGDLVRGVAGTSMREIPKLARIGTLPNWRLFGMRPESSWELNNIDSATRGVVDRLANANVTRATEPGDLEKLGLVDRTDLVGRPLASTSAYAMAVAPTASARMQIAEKVQFDTYESLVDHAQWGSQEVARGAKDEFRKLTTMWGNRLADNRKYATDAEGNNTLPSFLLNDGEPASAQPSVITEMNKSAVTSDLADLREIRAKTGMFAKLYNHRLLGALAGASAGAGLGYLVDGEDGALTGAAFGGGFGAAPLEVTRGLDTFYSTVFKPAVLLRPAHIVRLPLGIEQAQLASRGYESFFRHPLSYVATLLSRKGGITEADLAEAAKNPETWGAKVVDDYREAMSRRRGPVQMLDAPDDAVRLSDRVNYQSYGGPDGGPEQGFLRAWAEEIAKRHAEPVGRKLGEVGPEATKDWLIDGDGRSVLNALATMGNGWEKIKDPDNAKAYVDWLWNDVIKTRVGDDELTQALATGELRGEKLITTTPMGRPRVNSKALDILAEKLDVAPPTVSGDRIVVGLEKSRSAYRKFTDTAFQLLIGTPEDKLIRSPLFRQAMWARAAELSPGLSRDDALRLADIAEEQLLSGWKGKPLFRGEAAKVVDRIRAAASEDPVAAHTAWAKDAEAMLRDDDPRDAIFTVTGRVDAKAAAQRLQTGYYMGDIRMEPLDEAKTVYVEHWAIPESSRGERGIREGRQVIADADASGTTLYLQVDEENQRLVRFYERGGFQKVDRVPGVRKTEPGLIAMKREPRVGRFDDSVELHPDWVASKFPEEAQGKLSLKEVQDISSTYALETVKNTLHDLHHRDQFFDVFRLLMPFGDAWAQALQKWGTTFARNPALFHRVAQGMEAGRGSGFFRRNDEGEEVFTYPMSQGITDALVGQPIPLQAPVKGLSLMGELYPGAGPVATVLANAVLPDTPAVDNIVQVLFPYGRPEITGLTALASPMTYFDMMGPAWAKRLQVAANLPGYQRDYANTIMQIARMKLAAGDYRTDAAGTRELMADAKSDAEKLMALRVVAQATLPSAPQPDYQIEDAQGHLGSAVAAAKDLRKFEEENYDTSAERFIKKWGLNAYGAMQPLSQAITYSLPVTEKQVRWEKNNPEIAAKYSFVYGFFAPPDPKGKFDQQAYDRQIRTAQRFALDPGTWIRLAHNQIGRHLYQVAVDGALKANPRAQTAGNLPPDVRSQLAKYKDTLKKEWEGYDSLAGKVGRASTDDQIRQIRAATHDDALGNNQVVSAAAAYLYKRDQVEKTWQAKHDSQHGWQSAKSGMSLRQELADEQAKLKKKYPNSAAMFTLIFNYDVRGIDG